jgi:hypothetical protein
MFAATALAMARHTHSQYIMDLFGPGMPVRVSADEVLNRFIKLYPEWDRFRTDLAQQFSMLGQHFEIDASRWAHWSASKVGSRVFAWLPRHRRA